jgi:FolB domain-containing protein
MKQVLRIQDLEVLVNLGSSNEEQLTRQPVRFTFEMFFSEGVQACTTDELHDTVDYVELTQIMTAVATMKTYHLIEHLNQQVMNDLVNYLNNKKVRAHIKLSVHKVKVPIANLKNGVIFSCETSL